MGNVWADKIIEICHSMKALPEGGAFDVSWKKMLGELQRLSLEAGLDREDEFEESEHPRDEGGKFTEKGSGESSLPRQVREAIWPEENEAVFFSGCSVRGEDGKTKKKAQDVANEWADRNGGTTLNGMLKRNNVDLKSIDLGDMDITEVWKEVSKLLARRASGDVRVVAKVPLRENNFWETVELPELKKNKKIRSITLIDYDTGEKTVIFRR